MAFHHVVQRLLLIGMRLPVPPPPAKRQQPAALVPLIQAIAPSHRAFNLRAIEYGNRYRSAFWASYLLIALAVLCAGLPLALGWDDAQHGMHHFSVVWVVCELVIIVFVGLIYWRGHKEDWQGQWLVARTQAELTWYLPLVAPLVDFDETVDDIPRTANWYACLNRPGHDLQAGDDFDGVCHAHRELARTQLAGAWSDPEFITEYARWTVTIIEGQRQYHQHVARRQHALQHRVHAITAWLFVMTGTAALAHLFVHSNALTLATMFFPALGASLHGALAQSEAYRLEAASERLAMELGTIVEPVKAALERDDPIASVDVLRDAALSAVALILDEHQDWHMLVRPHHLPLG